MDDLVEKPLHKRRAPRWLTRMGVVAGCVFALGAGYAAAAGGLGSIIVFGMGLPGDPAGAGFRPEGLVAGSDGALWFSAVRTVGDSAVGRVSTDGTASDYTTGLSAGGKPTAMTEGPDGNVWFADVYPHAAIGRVTPTGTIAEFPTSSGVGAYGVAAGPDGNVWFAGGTKIGMVTPDGQMTTYGSNSSHPHDAEAIAAGSDGAMWFVDQSTPAAIGRITMDGTITEFSTGLAPAGLTTIAQGADGNMWFAEKSTIGRVTPSGQITEFELARG